MVALRKFYMLIATATLLSIPVCAATKAKSSLAVKASIVQIPVVKTTTIEGQGFLKTQAGEIKTCAGELISLYSKDDYMKFLGKEIYLKKMQQFEEYVRVAESEKKNDGTTLQSYYRDQAYAAAKELSNDYSQLDIGKFYRYDAFKEDIKKAKDFEIKKLSDLGDTYKVIVQSQCDASGNFSFKNIPFGSYGVVTSVTWSRVVVPKYIAPYTVLEGGKVGKEVVVDENLQKVFIVDLLPQARLLTP